MIDDIRIVPAELGPTCRLRAYASFTVGGLFVVNDAKVIRSADGRLHVAMPSRKAMYRCGTCGAKAAFDARFCAACGDRLPAEAPIPHDASGRPKHYHDIFHPIDAAGRELVHRAVLDACAAAGLDAEDDA